MPVNPEDFGPSQGGPTIPEPKYWEPQDSSFGEHQIYYQWCRLAAQNVPYARIARISKKWGHKYTAHHIRRVILSRIGQQLVTLYRAQNDRGIEGLQQEISTYIPEALNTAIEVNRDSRAEWKHRIHAAENIMDRGGLPKISRQQNETRMPTTVVLNILPQQLQQLLAPPPAITAEVVQIDEPESRAE